MIEHGDLQEYIVTIYGGKSATTLYYAGNSSWYDMQTQEYYNVVAWQPLPEPYKSNKDERKCQDENRDSLRNRGYSILVKKRS